MPQKKRRVFSPAEKLRVIQEAAACGPGEQAALLRREGIYSAHLTTWRRQLEIHGSAGVSAIKRGRKPKRDDKDRTIAMLEKQLRAAQSLSRPRVSNDNPFVESFSKTTKYQPEYPIRFASLVHVRAWFHEYFDWYCHHHHHQGLALFTPADVFRGRVAEIAATRQAARRKSLLVRETGSELAP